MKFNSALRLGGIAVVLVVSSVVLSACQKQTEPASNSTDGTAPVVETETTKTTETKKDAAVAVNAITINGSQFGPATLTVKPGATVTVTNNDVMGHSVTSQDNSSFDTGMFSKGKSVQFIAPTEPGSYPYYCIAHPGMKGTLIVAE